MSAQLQTEKARSQMVKKSRTSSIAAQRNNAGEPIGPLIARPASANGALEPETRTARKVVLAPPPIEVKLPAIPRPWANQQFADKRQTRTGSNA